jgi:hypothetical protein
LAPGVVMPAQSIVRLDVLPPATAMLLQNTQYVRSVDYVDTSPPVHSDIPIFIESLLI